MSSERRSISFTPEAAQVIRQVQVQMMLSAAKSVTFQDAVHYILGLGIHHMDMQGLLPDLSVK